MRKIRSGDTTPELLLRRELTKLGIRYRLHVKTLPGKPDIVLRKYRLVIFVDGAFWHGYEWHRKKQRIKTHQDYWYKKIEANMARDAKNNRELQELGFKVLRFWDHEIQKELPKCLRAVMDIVCPLNPRD